MECTYYICCKCITGGENPCVSCYRFMKGKGFQSTCRIHLYDIVHTKKFKAGIRSTLNPGYHHYLLKYVERHQQALNEVYGRLLNHLGADIVRYTFGPESYWSPKHVVCATFGVHGALEFDPYNRYNSDEKRENPWLDISYWGAGVWRTPDDSYHVVAPADRRVQEIGGNGTRHLRVLGSRVWGVEGESIGARVRSRKRAREVARVEEGRAKRAKGAEVEVEAEEVLGEEEGGEGEAARGAEAP